MPVTTVAVIAVVIWRITDDIIGDPTAPAHAVNLLTVVARIDSDRRMAAPTILVHRRTDVGTMARRAMKFARRCSAAWTKMATAS